MAGPVNRGKLLQKACREGGNRAFGHEPSHFDDTGFNVPLVLDVLGFLWSRTTQVSTGDCK
jgi:hypothetical protein